MHDLILEMGILLAKVLERLERLDAIYHDRFPEDGQLDRPGPAPES